MLIKRYQARTEAGRLRQQAVSTAVDKNTDKKTAHNLAHSSNDESITPPAASSSKQQQLLDYTRRSPYYRLSLYLPLLLLSLLPVFPRLFELPRTSLSLSLPLFIYLCISLVSLCAVCLALSR